MPTNTPPNPAMPASASPVTGKILLGLACLAVGFLVGYGAGRVSTGTPVNPLKPSGSGAPIGAEQGPENTLPLPPVPDESFALNGTVTAVAGTSLTFNADVSAFDPSGSKDLPVKRTADVTSETRIYRLVEKTPAEMNADQAAFLEASQSGVSNPPPPLPSPFKEMPMELSDIKAGDQVTVEAATDILKAESFVAVSIAVLPRSEPPAQPDEEPAPPVPPTP